MASKTTWFKRKTYGWGWSPASWRGWAVIGVYVFLILYIFKNITNQSYFSSNELLTSLLFFTGITILLFCICLVTGEKPSWNWGKHVEKQ